MFRKMPRFPLEMANGEKVRDIKSLRENADLESIIEYFLNGKLNAWCQVFRYEDISENLKNIKLEMMKKVCSALGVATEDDEIRKYVAGNIKSLKNNAVQLDFEYIKEKMFVIGDKDKILSNFTIEVFLAMDNDNTGRYKVDISENETEQYSSFVSPHNVNAAEESLEQLYNNITLSIQDMFLKAESVKNNR